MDLYLAIVVIMLVLAVAGLVVGVSNDAVNFLNSALGSKAAPRYVIMTVASVGIIDRGHYLQRYDGGRAQRRVPSADVHVQPR